MSTREHKIDPATLDDGTVVAATDECGDWRVVIKDDTGYQTFSADIGDGSPYEWGNWRIEHVLVPREEWEPLPDGPTEVHIGRTVRHVADGMTVIGMLTDIKHGFGFICSDMRGIGVGYGEWFVLVEPEPDDPDAALVEAVAKRIEQVISASAHWPDYQEAARAIIAAVREAGEQA